MKQELPLVSIVTPSYNKEAFIEETILSVKNQTYPRIEHIVVDGGSTDGTLDVLRRYRDSVICISEPDKGQSDAINKGWRMSNGEILAYLNADDTYMPWAVEEAVKFLIDHPEVSMVYGGTHVIDEQGRIIRRHPVEEFDLTKMIFSNILPSHATFFRMEVLDKVGFLDENLHMRMDPEFYIRVGLKFKIQRIPKILGNYREYLETKTMSQVDNDLAERFVILDKLFSNPELPKEIRVLKGKAYSLVNLKVGLRRYEQGQKRQAIIYLLRSIRLYPPQLLVIISLAKSSLKIRLGKAMSR